MPAGFVEALPNARPVAGCEFVYSSQLHHSAAGAFTAGFVLGLADRHQDNMLLCGARRDLFAHIDFGYVAGARPWFAALRRTPSFSYVWLLTDSAHTASRFDANLLPVPERFMRCCIRAGRWADFVNDVAFAFAILQRARPRLLAVASVFAEPIARAGYPAYIDSVLTTHTPETVRALASSGLT